MAASSARRRSATRIVSLLGDPGFHTAVWWLLLIMSGIMVIHNVYLRSWGIGTFPSFDRRIMKMSENGHLDSSPLVDADGKPSMLRYARTPVGRLLHILPAGCWSVIAPLQLNPMFRSKYRTAHRRLGRVFIGMSVSIALGIVPIVLSGAIKAEDGDGGGLLACAAYFLATALLAINHARNGRIAKHRVWILRHVAMGYSVHLQRLLGILSWPGMPWLFAGYADHTPAGARLRDIVFSTYFYVAVALSVGSMEVWLRHTSSTGVVLQNASKTN